MQSWVVEEAKPLEEGPLQIQEVELPLLKDDEVLLQVSACGVCHTDLHIIEGDLPLQRKLTIPGHQIIGKVVKGGERVERFKPGDWAGAFWLYETCSSCTYCIAGKENLCRKARFTGWHAWGGYASYFIGKENFLIPFPSKPEARQAPFLCAGVVGYRAIKVGGIQPGETVGLYGFGSSAHLILQILNHWGCRVLVVTRSPHHQKLAKNLGAYWVGRAEDTLPYSLEKAILFAPSGSLLIEALKNTKPNGKVISAGIHLSDIPSFPYRWLYEERSLTSVAHATRRDARELFDLIQQLDVTVAVEFFPFSQALEALSLLKARKLQASAVLIFEETPEEW